MLRPQLIEKVQKFQVRFATPEDRAPIQRFNARLAAGGATYHIPLDERMPGEAFAPESYFVFRRQLLLLEGEEVRGGILLQHHRLSLRGVEQSFCWFQLPLTEGLIDPTYASAAMTILKNALRHQPFAMGLGVGSMQETWAQLLVRTGWGHRPVPFFFYPLHPARVAVELRYLKSKPGLHLAARVAAYSGIASAAGALRGIPRHVRLARADAECIPTPDFDTWADQVYRRAAPQYGVMANRQAATLRVLYPPGDQRYIRLRVRSRAGEELGWIMLVHARMQENKYFGNLHVGTLVNGCCELRHVRSVLLAGFRELAALNVDLVVCNWSHHSWVEATRSIGFFSGPSNFFFFTSPAARKALDPAVPFSDTHLTRGDCDSPSSLMPAPGIVTA